MDNFKIMTQIEPEFKNNSKQQISHIYKPTQTRYDLLSGKSRQRRKNKKGLVNHTLAFVSGLRGLPVTSSGSLQALYRHSYL